jgi:hypothetical protein
VDRDGGGCEFRVQTKKQPALVFDGSEARGRRQTERDMCTRGMMMHGGRRADIQQGNEQAWPAADGEPHRRVALARGARLTTINLACYARVARRFWHLARPDKAIQQPVPYSVSAASSFPCGEYASGHLH